MCIINDPCLVRNYKAVFLLSLSRNIPIIVNSHFIDAPAEPKVVKDISYWLRQLDGHLAADAIAHTCHSTKKVFLNGLNDTLNNKSDVYNDIRNKKNFVWDDGYSHSECEQAINNIDNDFEKLLLEKISGKVLIFFPNRISQYADYTNSKIFIKTVNEVWEQRKDFSVIFGNPSQKTSNLELSKLVPSSIYFFDRQFNRNEYWAIIKNTDINAGLYIDEKYGGCAWRECVAMGTFPFSPYVNEYEFHMKHSNYPFKLEKDFSNSVKVLHEMIDFTKHKNNINKNQCDIVINRLICRIKDWCSYESTATKMIENIENVIVTSSKKE